VRRVFSPPPNVARVAALLAREVALTERAHRIVASRWEGRGIIECELAVVRRLLEELGYFGDGRSAQVKAKARRSASAEPDNVGRSLAQDRGGR